MEPNSSGCDPIKYSRGADTFDNTPIQLEAPDFDTFETQILSDRSTAKGKTYFCGPLSFGPHDRPDDFPQDAHYRLKTHAQERRFLAIDHDGFRDRPTFETIYSGLAAFRGFGYETWSSTAQAPRARLVLELNRQVDRAEGIALGAAFDRMLAEKYGGDSFQSDKSVHKNEQQVYSPGINARIFRFEGEPMDVDLLLGTHPPVSQPQVDDEHVTDLASPSRYARLDLDSLIKVLGLIDCAPEPNWHDVSNALARAYGEEGRDIFHRYSKGDFWRTPYQGYDSQEVDQKFNRSLRELEENPDGFGVRRLIEMSGLGYEQLTFEDPNASLVTTSAHSAALVTLPDVNTRGRPLQTSDNLEAVLKANRITVRYNQISKRCEYLVPGLSCVADENSNTTLTMITDLAVRNRMTSARVPEMLDALASMNPYCPVQTYIDSKPWDGISRFGQFTGQMKIRHSAFAILLIRKWLIQCVAAAYETEGIANAGVLTLLGQQGIGKTTFIKDLASGVPGTFLEGQTLNPADKDSVMTVAGHWIVELGELDSTIKKADISQLKAFITKTKDTLRRPYARKDSVFARRTVFAGTANDLEVLHDSSGNRRFWPVEVLAISRDRSIDYQQLWAEVKTWYGAGEKWYLDAPQLSQLEQYSEVFMTSDPDVERLLSRYVFAGCTTWKKESMKEICLVLGIEKPTRSQFMKLAAAIRKHNGNQQPVSSNGVKHHFVPAQILPPIHAQAASKPSGGGSGTSGTKDPDYRSLKETMAGVFSDP